MQPKSGGIKSYRFPWLHFPSRTSGSKDLLGFVVAARSFQGGITTYFGEANRSPARAHGTVENLLNNRGVAKIFAEA